MKHNQMGCTVRSEPDTLVVDLPGGIALFPFHGELAARLRSAGRDGLDLGYLRRVSSYEICGALPTDPTRERSAYRLLHQHLRKHVGQLDEWECARLCGDILIVLRPFRRVYRLMLDVVEAEDRRVHAAEALGRWDEAVERLEAEAEVSNDAQAEGLLGRARENRRLASEYVTSASVSLNAALSNLRSERELLSCLLPAGALGALDFDPVG